MNLPAQHRDLMRKDKELDILRAAVSGERAQHLQDLTQKEIHACEAVAAALPRSRHVELAGPDHGASSDPSSTQPRRQPATVTKVVAEMGVFFDWRVRRQAGSRPLPRRCVGGAAALRSASWGCNRSGKAWH
jgi:hypothetical protein